jgi:hypothetical protein
LSAARARGYARPNNRLQRTRKLAAEPERSSRHEVASLKVLKGGGSFRKNTWHVPASSYASVLATRCVVGAKPRRQCTELGSKGDRRTPPEILSGSGLGTGDRVNGCERLQRRQGGRTYED